jgi:hypothetical protein
VFAPRGAARWPGPLAVARAPRRPAAGGVNNPIDITYFQRFFYGVAKIRVLSFSSDLTNPVSLLIY